MSSNEDKKTKTIMSTRGHIYLKLKDENKGQVVKFEHESNKYVILVVVFGNVNL